MSSPSLDGVRLKLDRAKEHFDALECEVLRYLEQADHRFFHKFDPHLRAFYLYVEVMKQPPPQLGILVGEVLYNCSSALDHLVCQLARLTNRRHECLRMEFPVFTTDVDDYRKTTKRKGVLEGVPDEAKDIIGDLQPFQAREVGEDPQTHVLEILRLFHNIDKHRRLNLVATSVLTASYRPSHPDITPVRMHGGPIEGRTELCCFAVPYTVEGKVHVDCDVTIDVAINEGKGRWPEEQTPMLRQGLLSIHYWIDQEILPKFEPFFS
ncbi:MAG TPA: hypothetical protein VM784_03325 [Actinomycetota bacterium]|nr:hypothetical protein [Actinomycetota bacterium]